MPVVSVGPTLNLERILLATDFSASAGLAQSYARALALRFGSAIDVVHVFDRDGHAAIDDSLPLPTYALRTGIRQSHLAKLAEELATRGIEVTGTLREAPAAGHEILKCVDERGADMVVIGTHCKPSLERFLLGSTAEEVIRNAGRPVLTVGPNTKEPVDGPLTFRNIVYATDFSAQAAKAAVFALSFAEDSRAHLYYCHVQNESEDTADATAADEAFRAELRLLVPDCSSEWCTPRCVVGHGRAAEGILEIARRVNADLIVLGPRKPSFALTHVEKGVTLQVLCSAECPVLTVV